MACTAHVVAVRVVNIAADVAVVDTVVVLVRILAWMLASILVPYCLIESLLLHHHLL